MGNENEIITVGVVERQRNQFDICFITALGRLCVQVVTRYCECFAFPVLLLRQCYSMFQCAEQTEGGVVITLPFQVSEGGLTRGFYTN
jgi:hypothetical protein